MAKLSKHEQLKLQVMKALQDDEERQLQKDLIGALINEATPEEEPLQLESREAVSTALPELPAPAPAIAVTTMPVEEAPAESAATDEPAVPETSEVKPVP